MWLDNLKPWPLSNLFIKYPKAKFDLFHIGYPFQEEILALAKHFTSVYVDMCWAWIIDWHASLRFLKQYLTAAPANKLFAFGGDYGTPEPVYGHLRLARDGIARALSELVEENYFTKDEAIAIAHRILHDNAAVTFKVDAKMAALKQAQSQPS
jgi:predicted TIM-barrel fold metal-dependent hydrolase